MLDFLRNTNEQLEILLEGFVPNAEQLLPHSDVDLIRNHLPRDEAICAFATGRAVGAGRSVWVITTRSLLVVQTGKVAGVRSFPLEQIEQVEAEEGRYGVTLRAQCANARPSLYGVPMSFAVLALRALGRPAATDITAEIAAQTPTEAERAHAMHAFADLALRAQPLLAQSEAEARQLLQEAAIRARLVDAHRAAEAA